MKQHVAELKELAVEVETHPDNISNIQKIYCENNRV
jgi:hypothetical protein